MSLLTVHSTPQLRQFQTTLISRAFFFATCCFVVCLIAPLLISYSSHGFWLKHQIHREQPDVRFKYRALLLVRSDGSNYVTWSTFAEYNTLNGNNVVYPSITSSETDANDDGLMDGLDLNVQLDVTNQTARFIQLLLVFSYKLKEAASVHMEALGVIQYDAGNPMSKLHFVGDLQWVQRKTLPHRQTDNRYNHSVVNQFEIADILRAYNSREYAAELQHCQYTPTFAPASKLLTIQAHVRYTEAPVEYAPGIWQTLKWGWIQYVSILLVFLYAVGRLKDFVFGHQLLPTWDEKQIKATIRQ